MICFQFLYIFYSQLFDVLPGFVFSHRRKKKILAYFLEIKIAVKLIVFDHALSTIIINGVKICVNYILLKFKTIKLKKESLYFNEHMYVFFVYTYFS